MPRRGTEKDDRLFSEYTARVMKLLIVSGIFPPDHGGPAIHVPSIARGLQELGNEIVAVITLSERLDHDDRIFGYPVVRLPRQRFRPLRWTQTISRIALLARQADVVYLNGLVLEGILATRYIIKRPVVAKVVGDLVWEKARHSGVEPLDLDRFQTANLPIKWDLLRSLQRWYMARADAIITPSRYLSSIVAGWGIDPERIHTVYNAVALRSVPFDVKGPKLYDIVTVARLVPWKGLSQLIEVVAELRLRLRVVGDGPLRAELENLARNNGASVSFAGHVAHDHILDELRSARLFVLNSIYEGLPHVVLEAKAAGVAVLASSAGGTPETINHGIDGWLVPVNDKDALSKAIRYLLEHDEVRERLAYNGYKQVSRQFGLATQTQDIAKVLAEVCR